VLGALLGPGNEAQQLGLVPASSGTTSMSAIWARVRVPVLSRTTVSIRLERSSTSPPLINTPIDAPRPVPTMMAVGVARAWAHGQAMISTARGDQPSGGVTR